MHAAPVPVMRLVSVGLIAVSLLAGCTRSSHEPTATVTLDGVWLLDENPQVWGVLGAIFEFRDDGTLRFRGSSFTASTGAIQIDETGSWTRSEDHVTLQLADTATTWTLELRGHRLRFLEVGAPRYFSLSRPGPD
jgi:hypothetical protein